MSDRFMKKLSQQADKGVDHLGMILKCSTLDGYKYTIDDELVHREDVVGGKIDYHANHAFVCHTKKRICERMKEIHDTLVKDGVIYISDEARIIGKGIIKEVWVEVFGGSREEINTEDFEPKVETGYLAEFFED